MEQYVTRFVAGKFNGYGSWGENVGSWLANREGNDNFLLVRYEDMMDETIAILSTIAAFLGVKATAEEISAANERSSAEQMRKFARLEGAKWVTTREARQDKAFVRSASSGGWKTALPGSSVIEIEAAWGHTHAPLGLCARLSRRVGRSFSVPGRNRERMKIIDPVPLGATVRGQAIPGVLTYSNYRMGRCIRGDRLQASLDDLDYALARFQHLGGGGVRDAAAACLVSGKAIEHLVGQTAERRNILSSILWVRQWRGGR